MHVNQQAPEKRIPTSSTIEVHSIFYTIQGEGPHCGRPAVFVRLAGCNLQCPGCDTEYTDKRKPMTPQEIAYDVAWFGGDKRILVVISGGEPFRQDISQLCQYLYDKGYKVQIETNGTLPPSPGLPNSVDIVCSPKTGRINKQLIPRITALKYVLKAGNVDFIDGLPLSALDHTAKPYLAKPPEGFNGPIYLQPMDEQDEAANQRNLEAVINSCMTFGYTLQIQIHKIIEME